MESTSILLARKDIAMELLEFYKYSGIEEAYVSYNETASLYEVFVPLSYEKEAVKLANVFKQSKKESQTKDGDTTYNTSNAGESEESENSGVYVKREDKYKDVKSSGYTFLIVGFAGLVFMLLNVFGIINFYLASNIRSLTFIVMFGLFIGFIIIGIYSLQSAKKVAKEAEEENKLTTDIMEWFQRNFTGEDVDLNTDINLNKTSFEEVNYFKRTEEIKNIITQTYGELDASYLDKIADDLYQMLFD